MLARLDRALGGHYPTALRLDGMEVLTDEVWRARRAAHEQRLDAWTAPHLERRRRGEKHPVEDFLFDYYSYRPGQVRRWHPGAGVTLAGEPAREYLRHGYVETSR